MVQPSAALLVATIVLTASSTLAGYYHSFYTRLMLVSHNFPLDSHVRDGNSLGARAASSARRTRSLEERTPPANSQPVIVPIAQHGSLDVSISDQFSAGHVYSKWPHDIRTWSIPQPGAHVALDRWKSVRRLQILNL